MAKQGMKTLFSVGKGTVIIAVILFAIFAPFFMIIRKEKLVREYSQKRETLNAELLRLKSETASLEISIGQLSSAERLEKYAMDSLGLAPADPQKVIAVQRNKKGNILVSGNTSESFLSKLMGKK